MCSAFPRILFSEDVSTYLLALGTLVGWVSVVPGMVSNFWLGQQRRGLMLGFVTVTAFVPTVVAYAAPRDWLLASVTFVTSLPVLVLAFIGTAPHPRASHPEWQQDHGALLRYVPAGISIGVLSPAGSMLAIRSIVAEAMSWESSGYLQALWRVSDWVALIVGGVLSVYFLPRLSAAWRTPLFFAEVQIAAFATIIPSAIALLLLYAVHGDVFAILYAPGFKFSSAAVALFSGGTLVQFGAWVPLFALFAMRRTLSISIGELLSRPLFAVLLAFASDGLTLELASALRLASYCAFTTFNAWAVRRAH